MKKIALLLFLNLCAMGGRAHANSDAPLVALGRRLFSDASLSQDGKVSCESCHVPNHAFSDPRARSIGTKGRVGSRNAPSLIGIADDSSFFWDGRRTRLQDVVLDPFTNPVELGLSSREDLLTKLRKQPSYEAEFHAAFSTSLDDANTTEVAVALAAFVQTLSRSGAEHDVTHAQKKLSMQEELGKRLFENDAECSQCHISSGDRPRFTDEKYHHSVIASTAQLKELPDLVQTVVVTNLSADALGPKLLMDQEWSSLGRFVITHHPADIGSFRTPSLRNVAVTAPYMHDGSIATLQEAVDHEIYYRRIRTGHSANFSMNERQAIVAFLETLTDPGVDRTPPMTPTTLRPSIVAHDATASSGE